jgi:hypothetical protein
MRTRSLTDRSAAWLDFLGPIRTAFFGSLLLSFVAVQTSPILNRDGMLYIETARGFLERGMAGSDFDWLFLPLLIAVLSYITHLDLEPVAYILNALFLAGTCALMVDLTRRRMPEITWATCLAVLTMPAFNGYRDYLLREYGYWFLSALAFWLAMRWEQRAFRWREAVACQLALACAALFRLEAGVFFLALVAWQLFSAPAERRWQRVLMIGWLPLGVVTGLIVLTTIGAIALPARVVYYLDAANILGAQDGFGKAVSGLVALLPKYSSEEAAQILLIGLLAMIPVKFLKMSGVFVLPFLYGFVRRPAREVFSSWPLLSWAFLAHVVALGAFVTYQLFLIGRHVSILNLLAIPVFGMGLALLMARFPRWKVPMLALAVLTMLANVISLSPGNTQLRIAGEWLAANSPNPDVVYVDDPRVAYYAGWGFSSRKQQVLDQRHLEQAVTVGRYSMLVLAESRRRPWIDAWLAVKDLRPLRRFDNGVGQAVVVVQLPAAPNPPDFPASGTDTPPALRPHVGSNVE